MNWKLVAAMCVGAGLLTACGAQKPAEAPAPSQHRGVTPEEETQEGAAAPKDPAAAAPASQPQGIMVPERKDR